MLRRLTQAAAIIALLTGSAYAQNPMMPSLHLGGDKPPATPEEIAKQKAIDNAYKAATNKIPDKQQAADPWGNIRSNPNPVVKKKPD